MKEIFSKFTFGFLMAQFFPGAVVVFSVGCFFIIPPKETTSIVNFCKSMVEQWTSDIPKMVIFGFLSVGFGMSIHSLNWMVLAWLENRDGSRKTRIYDYFYHKKRLVIQILIGPVIMVCEIIGLLFCKSIDILRMEENLPHIKPEKIPAFTFLQDFYLYFAQFYLHTSYALLFGIPIFLLCVQEYADCYRFCLLLVSGYCCVGYLFVAGRVQLLTLFKAECEMIEKEGEESIISSG